MKRPRYHSRFTVRKLLIWSLVVCLLSEYFFSLPFNWSWFPHYKNQVQAGWMDDRWGYRQKVAITNTSGSTQSDFQVMVTLDTQALLTSGKIQSNCADIRITDINGKKLPYWLEPNTCNTTTTKIWTKIPSIPTSGATLYTYYGNPNAVSESSTSTVFIREISNVVGAWNMDESSWNGTAGEVKDSSGNGLNGQAVTGTNTTSGKFGNAGSFDGIGKYINITGSNSLAMKNNFAISAWVMNTNSNIANTVERIFWSDKWAFGRYGNNIFFTTYGIKDYFSSISVSQNTWMYVVVVFDSLNNASFYANGIYKGSVQGSTPISVAPSNFAIGVQGGNSQYWSGLIDESRIYSKALSQSEISDLYGSGGDRLGYTTVNYPGKELVRKYNASVTVGTPGSEEVSPAPIAYWKFDEGQGTTAFDSAHPGGATTNLITNPNLETGTSAYTAYSGATITSSTAQAYIGSKSGLVTFPAGDGYIDINLNTADATPLTGSVWVYVTSGSAYLRLRESTSGTIYATASTSTTNQWVRLVVTGTPSANGGRITLDGGGVSAGTATYYVDAVQLERNTRVTDYCDGSLTNRGVAKWSGTAHASSSICYQGNNGTINGATWATEDQCISGKCLKFDGSSSYVSVANAPSLNPSKNITVSAWIKVTGGAGTWRHIVSKPTSTTWSQPFSSYVLRLNSSNKLEGWVVDNNNNLHSTVGNATINADSSWKLVTMTYDGSKLSTYINGNLDNSTSFSISSLAISNQPLVIGVRNSISKGEYFNGLIDDTKIFSYARTADQIKADYDAGKGKAGLAKGANTVLSANNKQGDFLSQGLVGYWKMDEASWNGTTGEVKDSSGNGNNGTAVSGASTAGGKFGNGGSFDGTSKYASVNSSNSMNVQTGAFTLSAWINSTGQVATSDKSQPIISKAMNSATFTYLLSFNSNQIGFSLYNGSNNPTMGSNTNLSYGTWYFVTAVYDISSMKLYINGALDKTLQNPNVAMNATSGPVEFGAWPFQHTTRGLFNGHIDEARIYNRALSPAEVSALYNWAPGPLINMNFESSSGNTYYDKSGYGHNATIQDLASNSTCNDFVFRVAAKDTWVKIHDSISALGGITVQDINKTITYTKGVDYDIDYPSGQIKILTGGTMAVATYYYTSTTCTNTGPKIVTGKNGKGIQFDGADDSIMINSASDLAFGPTSNVTQEAWVYKNSDSYELGDLVNQGIVGQNFSSPRIMYGAKTFNTMIQFTDQYRTLSTPANYLNKTWYHVAATWDGKYSRIYVNGVLAATSADWSGYTVTSVQNNYYIGRNQSGASRGIFNGIIDDIKIYNYVRTQKQIEEDMNSGKTLASGGGGSGGGSMVGYWKFDEGSGGTVHNVGNGGSALDGTWNGAGGHWTSAGKFSKAGKFNGSSDYVSIPTVSNVQSVSFWVNPVNSSQPLLTLASGITATTSTNAVITAGFTSPTIYVNGKASSTIQPNTWNHVVIVDSAGGISANSFTLGKIGSTYLSGMLDEVKLYNYTLTADEVKEDYNRGSAMVLGAMGDDTTSLTKGLVGYWKMDEASWNGTAGEVKDSSGNGNNGKAVCDGTGCTVASPTSGKYSNAESVNGTSYVQVPDSPSLIINGDKLTMSAWIYKNDSLIRTVISKGYNVFRLFTTPGSFGVDLNINGSDNLVYAGASCNLINQWQLISVTYDGANISFYCNGVFINKVSATGNLFTSSSTLKIGGLATQNFLGGLDDVRIYNRALSDKEVAQLYAYNPANSPVSGLSSAAKYCIPGDTAYCTSPVAEYNFEEGSGTTAKDTSGNNNNGTWSGTGSHYTTGKAGKAGNFNGIDDNVTIPENNVLDIRTGSMSWGIWFKTNKITRGILYRKSGNNNSLGVLIDIGIPASGQLRAIIHYSPQITVTSQAKTYNDNKWHYLSVTFNRSDNTLKLYIDGKYDNSVDASSIAGIDLNAVDSQGFSSYPYFSGQMDQIRIYNYARTPAQIAWDYNEGAPVAWWKFDEKQGTIAHDAGINAINATVNGSDWTQGKINGGINFNNHQINLGDQSLLEGQSSVSISAWHYPTALAGSDREIIKKGDWNVADSSYRLMYQTDWNSGTGYPNGMWRFYLKHDGDHSCSADSPIAFSNSRLNKWTFVTGTWDGSNAKIYVNGQLAGSKSCSGSVINTNTYPLYLNNNAPGTLDEVRFYNYALTASQVQTLFNENSAVRYGQ